MPEHKPGTRGSKGVGGNKSGAETGCVATIETRGWYLQGPILLSLPGSEIPVRLCSPQGVTSRPRSRPWQPRKKGLESCAANRAAHPTFTIAANLTLPPLWPEAWALRAGGCFRGDGSLWGFPGLQECPDGLPSTSSGRGEDQQGVTDGLAFGRGKQEPLIPMAQKDPRLAKANPLQPRPCQLGSETSQVLGPRKPPAPAVPVNQARPCIYQAPNIYSKCNHSGRPGRTVGLEA